MLRRDFAVISWEYVIGGSLESLESSLISDSGIFARS